MKIKEFSIRKYGPLIDSARVPLGDFNLFWAENEEGKTLTLEGIVRMLLGKHSRIIPGLLRVESAPDGYLILEDDNGEEYTMPDQGSICDLIALSPAEFRNLFIIRDSDLSIARENEFYGDITERLTGIRTRQIQKIMSELRKLGSFTDGMDTVNHKESQYLKRRLDQAKAMIDEISELLQKAHAQGYDAMEEHLARLQTRAREIEAKAGELERARLRERYETGKKNLDAIHTLIDNIESERAFDEEELNDWRQHLAGIEDLENERAQLLARLEIQSGELEEMDGKLSGLKSSIDLNQQRRTQIQAVLKPQLNHLASLNADFAKRTAGRSFFKSFLLIAVMVSLASLGAILWKPGVLTMTIAGSVGTLTFTAAMYYYYRFIRPTGDRRQMIQQIIDTSAELGLPGEEIPQIQEQINRFEEQLQRQLQRQNEIEGRVAYLRESCKSLKEDQLEAIAIRIQKSIRSIEAIRQNRGVETPDSYLERLTSRQTKEGRLKEAITILKTTFKPAGSTVAEWVRSWKKSIAELEQHRNGASATTFDEKQWELLQSEQKELLQRIDKARHRMRDFQEVLLHIERRTNEVLLIDEGSYSCRTFSDLPYIQEQLQEFLNRSRRQQSISRHAIRIFEDIERDEQDRVGSLFGKESRVSKVFSGVTAGVYPRVYYDAGASSILVERKDGKTLMPDMLSGGAYDQLYFAVRLALAEKLFHSEKGFFVLDDPFLKSDGERLRRQLDNLIDISQQGWQIIYFSAKEEVKNALQKYIDKKMVELKPVPGLRFEQESMD